MDWRIYYDDGTTFDSAQGTPYDAPADGVIAIVMPWNGRHRPIAARSDRNGDPLAGENWYFWHAGELEWWGCDREGLFDQLKRNPRTTQAVKQGRTVSVEQFAEIIRRASNDPDFPVGERG